MSLVTTPVSSLAVCGSCSGTRVTAISMTLTDGSSVDFASCHRCENRSWTQGGRELDIATVLGKTRKTKQTEKPPVVEVISLLLDILSGFLYLFGCILSGFRRVLRGDWRNRCNDAERHEHSDHQGSPHEHRTSHLLLPSR